ncbi:major facilitator superfamily domain-containing protein [Chiua virens]|nr:major facilitator superfamily domain-containing protein [Chiua virens]
MTPTTTLSLEPTVEGGSEAQQSPSKDIDPFLVTLEPEDNPQCMSTFRRWLAVLVISSASLCATCASSVAAFTEAGSSQTFHVSHEVTILGISLYVSGLGAGPLLVGPLSEMYGRNIIYRISYILFFILTFPVAFAPNIGVFLVFRLLTGLCGAAFLSVAGGSVSDMFPNTTVAKFINQVSSFIKPWWMSSFALCSDQNASWRWTYWFMLCWIFVENVLLFLSVPETYVPIILKEKAARLRKVTGNVSYYAPSDNVQDGLVKSMMISCYRPFRMFCKVPSRRRKLIKVTELLIFDRMALLLDTWYGIKSDRCVACIKILLSRNALLLGILYLAFQAFPIIFEDIHHFNDQMTGLTFIGIGVGMLAGISTQPFWNKLFARESLKHDGNPPPEVRLIMGQVGAVLVPVGLFWLAFTTYPQVHWIAPIIASVPFGAGIYFVFTSTFTYLVTAYRPIAASAMAANSALRSTFAAVFPLFASAMYDRLGTVGATALLAGLTTIMAPLPFIFYRIGARLRSKSKFAVS